jgi:hypothetical protein
MSYYINEELKEPTRIPTTQYVDRILNKRRGTLAYTRATTPEPRSIMADTGASMIDSRLRNVRARIEEEIGEPAQDYAQ